MMSPDPHSLKHTAHAIRDILEEFSRDTENVIFHKFPEGACGGATDLIIRYLKEKQGIDAKYVEARCGQQTHAWALVGEIIIDITADQFAQEPVIVKTDSAWHSAWEEQNPRTPCEPKEWSLDHFSAWEAILKGMKKHSFN